MDQIEKFKELLEESDVDWGEEVLREVLMAYNEAHDKEFIMDEM